MTQYLNSDVYGVNDTAAAIIVLCLNWVNILLLVYYFTL